MPLSRSNSSIRAFPGSNPSEQTAGFPSSSAATLLIHGPPTTTKFLFAVASCTSTSSTAAPTATGFTLCVVIEFEPPDVITAAPIGATKTS